MIATAGRILVCVAVGVVSACAQLAATGTADVAGRQRQAEAAIARGDLSEALIQLKVLETLRSDDAEIARKRAAVEAEVERLAEGRYEQAEAELKRNSRAAYRDYLAVLTYNPAHEGALRRLRQLELQRNRASRPAIGGPDAPTRLAYPDLPVETARPLTNVRPPPSDFPKPQPKPEPPAAGPTAVASVQGEGDEGANAARRTAAGGSVSGASVEQSSVARRSPQPADAGEEIGTNAGKSEEKSVDIAIATAKAGTYLNLIQYAETYLASHPEDDKAMELLALSHEKAGLALYQDGKLRQSLRHLEFAVAYSGDPQGPPATALAAAKTRLADETFELGVRAFRDDISQAIAYWEETLTYDPGHAKAKQFLSKAYRIRDTLNEISNP